MDVVIIIIITISDIRIIVVLGLMGCHVPTNILISCYQFVSMSDPINIDIQRYLTEYYSAIKAPGEIFEKMVSDYIQSVKQMQQAYAVLQEENTALKGIQAANQTTINNLKKERDELKKQGKNA